jgi:stress response protein YsnF
VILLSEEVPVVQLHTRPYERVTVHVDTVTEQVEVTHDLAREQADVRSLDAGQRPT